MASAPLRDYLDWHNLPGVRRDHVVIPRRLAETMPAAWQQDAATVLAEFHRTHAAASWPIYRVAPSRTIPLADCTEDLLARLGITAAPDDEGGWVFCHRDTGETIPDPVGHRVLVDVDDDPPQLSAVGRVPWCWWVGVHGGAGVTSLAAVVDGTGDGGQHPPVDAHSPWMVAVARTHQHGLDRAEQFAARTPPGLVGLVTIADAPGTLPKALQRRRDQVEAAYARAWRVAWIPEWRETSPQPGQALPASVRSVAVEAARIVSELAS